MMLCSSVFNNRPQHCIALCSQQTLASADGVHLFSLRYYNVAIYTMYRIQQYIAKLHALAGRLYRWLCKYICKYAVVPSVAALWQSLLSKSLALSCNINKRQQLRDNTQNDCYAGKHQHNRH
jgi:hypothetical protein